MVLLIGVFTDGIMSNYLCTYGEIRLYFENIEHLDAPKPNGNCNATSWDSQCESGWAGAQFTVADLTSSAEPIRGQFPLPCCDGIFCPPLGHVS